jgi:hypothetical protein
MCVFNVDLTITFQDAPLPKSDKKTNLQIKMAMQIFIYLFIAISIQVP